MFCTLAVDASWQPWGNWGACDATCGDGNRQRTRSCTAAEGTGASCADITAEGAGNQNTGTETCTNVLTCPGKKKNTKNLQHFSRLTIKSKNIFVC